MKGQEDMQAATEREPRTLARRRDPDTSKAAAGRVREFAQAHREQILRALRDHPEGLTVHEIAAFTRLDAHAIGKRMNELQADALVYVMRGLFSEELTRPSPSGRQSRVWSVMRFGKGGVA